jgi:hypothetical protein
LVNHRTGEPAGKASRAERPPAGRLRREAEAEESGGRELRSVYCIECDEPLVHFEGSHQQTRFFVVAPPSAIAHYVAKLPPAKQHLYEILREGEPCYLYLDVEVDLCDIADPAHLGESVSHDAVDWATLANFRACAGCDGAPFDSRLTTRVLMRELRSFLAGSIGLHTAEDDFLVLRSRDRRSNAKFSQHWIVRPSLDDLRPGFVFPNNAVVGLVVAAFVQHLCRKAQGEREVRQALFYHGKEVVSVPVATPSVAAVEGAAAELSSLVAVDRVLDAVPLKCTIDEAVYTRNRMFRCLQSCKLGKPAVLDLDPDAFATLHPPACVVQRGSGVEAWLRHSFITLRSLGIQPESVPATCLASADACEEAFLAIMSGTQGAAARAALRGLTAAQRAAGDLTSAPLLSTSGGRSSSSIVANQTSFGSARRLAIQSVPMLRAELEGIARRSASKGTAVSVTSFLSVGGAIVASVTGTRYCARVKREHKSNGVYFVVHLASGHAVQKCHDPDCAGFAAPPFDVSPAAIAEVAVAAGASHDVPTSSEGKLPNGRSHVEGPSAVVAGVRAVDLSEAQLQRRTDFNARCTRFVPKSPAKAE